MMTTVRYRPLLCPLGLLGLGVSYYLYVRDASAVVVRPKRVPWSATRSTSSS
jgi:hypothetical protein